MSNILNSILKALKVRHTGYFANKIYSQHPFRNTFLGLSKMLDVYGINNLSLKAEDTKMYEMFECPFIAKLGAGFVLVHSIDAHNVKYQINKRLETLSLEDFIKRSSGEILLFENNEECREPNYRIVTKLSAEKRVSSWAFSHGVIWVRPFLFQI